MRYCPTVLWMRKLLGTKRPLKIVQTNLLVQGGSTIQLALQDSVQAGFENLKGQRLHSPLGNLCQCLTSLMITCPMFKGCSLCSDVCPLPPLLSLGTNTKSLAFPVCPLTTSVHVEETPLSLLFSRMSSPSSLSLSTGKRYSSPFTVFGRARDADPAGREGGSSSLAVTSHCRWRPENRARVRQQVSGGLGASLGQSGGAALGRARLRGERPVCTRRLYARAGVCRAGLGRLCRAGLVRAMQGGVRARQRWENRVRVGRAGQGWRGCAGRDKAGQGQVGAGLGRKGSTAPAC